MRRAKASNLFSLSNSHLHLCRLAVWQSPGALLQLHTRVVVHLLSSLRRMWPNLLVRHPLCIFRPNIRQLLCDRFDMRGLAVWRRWFWPKPVEQLPLGVCGQEIPENKLGNIRREHTWKTSRTFDPKLTTTPSVKLKWMLTYTLLHSVLCSPRALWKEAQQDLF